MIWMAIPFNFNSVVIWMVDFYEYSRFLLSQTLFKKAIEFMIFCVRTVFLLQ